MAFPSLHFLTPIFLTGTLLTTQALASDFHVEADVSSTKLNKYGRGLGAALSVGYKINEAVTIDGGYRYVGRVDYNDFPVDVSMWFLSSSLNKRMNDSLEIYGKLGVGFAALYVKNTAFSRESFAPFFGIGVRNAITKDLGLNLEAYSLAGVANGVSIGLRYNF
jgi:OmpA-like transmembrane domain